MLLDKLIKDGWWGDIEPDEEVEVVVTEEENRLGIIKQDKYGAFVFVKNGKVERLPVAPEIE